MEKEEQNTMRKEREGEEMAGRFVSLAVGRMDTPDNCIV